MRSAPMFGATEGARELIARVSGLVDRLDVIVHCGRSCSWSAAAGGRSRGAHRSIVLNGISLVYLVQAAGPLLKPGIQRRLPVESRQPSGCAELWRDRSGQGAGRSLRAISDAGTRGARRSHQFASRGHLGHAAVRDLFGQVRTRSPTGGRRQSERAETSPTTTIRTGRVSDPPRGFR